MAVNHRGDDMISIKNVNKNKIKIKTFSKITKEHIIALNIKETSAYSTQPIFKLLDWIIRKHQHTTQQIYPSKPPYRSYAPAIHTLSNLSWPLQD